MKLSGIWKTQVQADKFLTKRTQALKRLGILMIVLISLGLKVNAYRAAFTPPSAHRPITQAAIGLVQNLDADGRYQELFSDVAITLARGQTARIIWGKGPSETDEIGDADNDGIREIYLDEDKPTKSGDQIVLRHNGRMLDAVVFADWENPRFSYPEQDDVKRLIAEHLWQADDLAMPQSITTGGNAVKRRGGEWQQEG